VVDWFEHLHSASSQLFTQSSSVYGLALGAIGKVGAEILKKGDVSEKRQDLPKLDTIPDWIERGLSGNEYFSDESANAKFWLNGSIRRLDEMKARLARTLHEDADLFRQKTLSDIPNEKEICGRLYQMLFSLC
jgi:hypothetical protein